MKYSFIRSLLLLSWLLGVHPQGNTQDHNKSALSVSMPMGIVGAGSLIRPIFYLAPPFYMRWQKNPGVLMVALRLLFVLVKK